MQVLILAGGFGSRLMPIINDRPKVMAPLHGRPFLEYIIQSLKRWGVTEIVLALGYLSGYIQDYFGDGKGLGVNIRYSIENIPLGTAGALKNAEKILEDKFIVINGDTYLDLDYNKLCNFHKLKKADVTIILTVYKHSLGRGIVRLDNSGKVSSFRELQSREDAKNSYTNAGIYAMDKKILQYIKKGEKVSLEKNIFPQLLSQRQNVYGFIAAGDFIDIGTPERFKVAQEKLQSVFKKYG